MTLRGIQELRTGGSSRALAAQVAGGLDRLWHCLEWGRGQRWHLRQRRLTLAQAQWGTVGAGGVLSSTGALWRAQSMPSIRVSAESVWSSVGVGSGEPPAPSFPSLPVSNPLPNPTGLPPRHDSCHALALSHCDLSG